MMAGAEAGDARARGQPAAGLPAEEHHRVGRGRGGEE